MFVTLYETVHFRLLGTNEFHVKVENERFSAAGSRYRQNFKYENFTSSFGSRRCCRFLNSLICIYRDFVALVF